MAGYHPPPGNRGASHHRAGHSSLFGQLLNELAAEFEAQYLRIQYLEHRVAGQMVEMQHVSEKLHTMEQAHLALTQSHELDVAVLGRQLAEIQAAAPSTAIQAATPPTATQPPHDTNTGSGWNVTFNPEVQRVLDVDLVLTIPHERVVCCVQFSHDGKYIATGSNRSAQIFDVQTGSKVCVLEHDSEVAGELYIRSICFGPNDRYLATVAEDRLIRVWDIQSRTIISQFAGHTEEIYALTFAPDGRTVVSGSGDNTVRIWDITKDANTLTFNAKDGISGIAISPDMRYVAASSLDNSVYIWDLQSQSLVGHLMGPEGHTDAVYCLAFMANGNGIVSGSFDKTIKMWELKPNHTQEDDAAGPKGGACIKTFEGHQGFILAIALTPDDTWVVSGSKDCSVHLWDRETGTSQFKLEAHKNSVISVATSPVAGYFASGSGDKTARIWHYRRI